MASALDGLDPRPQSRLLRFEPLAGGMSAEIVRLVFADGSLWVARRPSLYVQTLFEDAAAHEARVLAAVNAAGLPTPACHGHAEGLVFMDYLPGIATARPAVGTEDHYVDQLAKMLAQIHQVDTAPFGFLPVTNRVFEPPTMENRPASHPITQRAPEIASVVMRVRPGLSADAVLRHGDFWPGNVLWDDGTIVGVIDWENALLGPAIADLAISRLDIAWILGFDAMERFTRTYLREFPVATDDLAYWDLRAALRPMGNLEEWPGPYKALGRTDIDVDTMADTLNTFIDLALQKLA